MTFKTQILLVEIKYLLAFMKDRISCLVIYTLKVNQAPIMYNEG